MVPADSQFKQRRAMVCKSNVWFATERSDDVETRYVVTDALRLGGQISSIYIHLLCHTTINQEPCPELLLVLATTHEVQN